MKENEPIEKPIDITYYNRTFRYQFEDLSILQAEGAIEVLKFKLDQENMIRENFKQGLSSEGYKWLSICASFLFCELKDGKPVIFNEAVQKETELFIQSLPQKKFYKILEDCTIDFFSKRDMKNLLLLIQPKKRSESVKETFVKTFVEKMMGGTLQEEWKKDK